MIRTEAALPEDKRMDFVSIVTPNHMHFPAAKAGAWKAGFHVLSDKPSTFNLAQAKELAQIVKSTGKLYGVTYNYTGYPMIRQARQMIEEGKLGAIRKVVAEYPQGWLATMLENTGPEAGLLARRSRHLRRGGLHGRHRHARDQSSPNTLPDCTSRNSRPTSPSSWARKAVVWRTTATCCYASPNGAKGVLHSSQISVGCENNLSLRVYGELGGLEWSQLDPNTMIVTWLDQPKQIYRTSMGYLGSAAAAATRTPAGHPEGYLEGFANLYTQLRQPCACR